MNELLTMETSADKVSVYTFATPDHIGRLTLDEQFSEHTGFRSLFTRHESLMMRAAEEDANVVLAVTGKAKIIGFGVLAYPGCDQRWSKLAPKSTMEVRAIEVTRDFRNMGIASAMVKGMLTHPDLEEKIIYFVGYTWIWDLTGAKMSSPQYRKMMISLFTPFHFKEYLTNEPNVCLDTNNLLMCRIGGNVGDRLRDDFKWLLFGVYP